MLKILGAMCGLALFLAAVAVPAGTAVAGSDYAAVCGSGHYDNIIDLNVTPGAQGTGLRNIIIGTNGPDVINGGAGNDCIIGHGGNDIINGGSGNDIIVGDWGYDRVDGGSGSDKCDAESKKSCEGSVQFNFPN